MTEQQAASEISDALSAVGIGRGDVVYLGVDMARVPLPAYPAPLTRAALREREQRWCAFLFDLLFETVGESGTLLAPTFSYAYARDGVPYVHETTPSETGPFTEFLRTRDGAIRSFHPLNSISGVGPAAADILEDAGRAGYGAESPFARLRAYGTKFLFLGAPLGIALTHAHHLEHMYGVNHMYHKLYTLPAMRAGVEDPGPWLCFVRYLGAGIEPRIENLEHRLRRDGYLSERPTSAGGVQAVDCEAVERTAYAMLRETPCAFVADPVEVHVAAPGAAEQPVRARAVRLEIR